jgi:hypothetical protein
MKKQIRKTYKCHDCEVPEGHFHVNGCSQARCHFCGEQEICCDCQHPARERYWQQVNTCALCGRVWPKFFEVTNEEWAKEVPIKLQKEVLCRICYSKIWLANRKCAVVQGSVCQGFRCLVDGVCPMDSMSKEIEEPIGRKEWADNLEET